MIRIGRIREYGPGAPGTITPGSWSFRAFGYAVTVTYPGNWLLAATQLPSGLLRVDTLGRGHRILRSATVGKDLYRLAYRKEVER